MHIAPGTRFDHYEIRSFLGKGGMGEVYLAQDTKTGRLAALKLLPPEFAGDPERLRRFEQEALVTSQLEHDHIVAVYEVSAAPPAPAHGRPCALPFLTMEYVEGGTLRRRMSAGRMCVGEAVGVAVQVAEALAAAHAYGVVHRDVKPENIMFDAEGRVKVLDFGLAKLTEPLLARLATPDAHTLTNFNTGLGEVIGTVNYISPEQLRGQKVDGQTDIWSLGVLLYEMLTGELPFQGSTTGEKIVSILEREPPPLSRYWPDAPPGLARIIAATLTKNRKARYQSARGLLDDLKGLQAGLSDDVARAVLTRGEAAAAWPTARFDGAFGTDPDAAETAAAGRGTFPNRMGGDAAPGLDTPSAARRIFEFVPFKPAFLLPLLLGVACGLGLLSYFVFLPRRPPVIDKEIKFSRLELPGEAREAAVSPDGQQVAAVLEDTGGQRIFVRRVADGGHARVIPHSGSRLRGLTFSPGGDYVYYLESEPETATLFRAPAGGGPPTRLLAGVNTPVTFSPDGRRIAFVRYDAGQQATLLVTADADGANERTLHSLKSPLVFTLGGARASGPVWSPDGKIIACPTMTLPDMTKFDVYAVGVDDGALRRVGSRGWQVVEQLAWLADGSGLLMNASDEPAGQLQVWLLSYPGGEARRVTNDPNNYQSLSLTKDGGLLVAVKSSLRSGLWVSPVEGTSMAAPLPASKYKGVNGIAWTSAGRLVYTSTEGGNVELWAMAADGSDPRRLVGDGGHHVQPSVAADGRNIVFVSHREGAAHIWRADADGTPPKQLTVGDYEDTPQLSPDGRWVVYHGTSAAGDRLWRVSVDGGEPRLLTDRPSLHPAVSPDGKWVAYFTRDDRPDSQWRLVIIPAEGGPPLKTFDIPAAAADMGSQVLRWRPGGEGLAYIVTSGTVSNVWWQPLRGGSPSPMTDFKDERIFAFAFSPDGRQVVCVRGARANDVVLLTDFS